MVEREEVVEVDNGDDGDYWCRVWSQTREKVYCIVHNKDGWTCECESYMLGHKVCRHMRAAFILAASGTRLAKRRGLGPTSTCRRGGAGIADPRMQRGARTAR